MKYDEIKNMTIEELCNELDRKDKIINVLTEQNQELTAKNTELSGKVANLSRDQILKDLLNSLKNNVDLHAKITILNREIVEKRLIIEDLTEQNKKLKKLNNTNHNR